MKTSLLRSLVVAALACILCPFSTPAAANEGNGHLIVRRAANYGHNLDLIVFVDGQRVARLPFGQTYDAFVPAGPHDIVTNVSNMHRTNSAHVHVVVVSGKTYEFSGGFDGYQQPALR